MASNNGYYDDNIDNNNDNVAPYCCWFSCYLSDAPTRKVSRFVGCSDKNSKHERKTEAKQ